MSAGGVLGFLSHRHPEFISGSPEKGKEERGKRKEGRVKREEGRGHAWLSHFTEMTAVIRYPCDCEPFTEHEHFGFSWDVRNGERFTVDGIVFTSIRKNYAQISFSMI